MRATHHKMLERLNDQLDSIDRIVEFLEEKMVENQLCDAVDKLEGMFRGPSAGKRYKI